MTGVPKYQQIVDWIENRIRSSELKDGDKLETEQEICKRFQVSRQTVRQALSRLETIGTLERVQGSGSYVRNKKKQFWTASSVRLSRTVTIISSYVDNYIFPRILHAMVKRLEMAGYTSRIMFTSNHVEKERQFLEQILEEHSLDPMIVEPVMSGLPNPNLKYYKELRRRGIPILFFNSFYAELDIPHVSMDDIAAGRLATEYLIQAGHKKISGIFKADDGQGRHRYQGYLEALIEEDIPIEEGRICWIDTQEQKNLLNDGEVLLRRISGCTACVCYNDEVAHMLTEICRKKGIEIPEELSIASIDNSELARLNFIPLTSVMHPMERLGEIAAENLINIMKNPGYEATYEFEVEIMERNSVKKIR